MAEVVVTQFELDTSRFTADIKSATEGMTAYDKAAEEAIKDNAALSNSMGSAAQRTKELSVVSAQAARSVGSIGSQAPAVSKTGGALSGLSRITDGLKAKFQGVAATFQNGVKSIGTSISSAGSGIKGFFGNLTNGLTSAVPGISGLGGSFTSLTSPVGIAAAAVGAFLANFSRLDSVQVFFDAVKIGFDQIRQRLTSFEGFKGLFDPAQQAKDAAFALQTAKGLDFIADKQREVTVANAEADKQQAALNQRLRDRTLTEEERLRVADQITAIEEDRAAKEIALAQQRVVLANAQIANLQRLSTAADDISDADLDAQAQAVAALRQAEASKIALIESTERRRNAIIEQGASERAATEQKAAQAAEKAAQESAKRAADIAAAEGSISELTAKLAQEQVDAQATAAQREVLVVERKYADIEARTKEAFAKLSALAPSGDRIEIAQREADAIVTIEAAKVAELEALDKKRAEEQARTREEAVESLRQALLSETEAEREAILVRLDEQRALAEANIENVEERARVIAELTKKAEEDLTAVVTDEQQKRLEAEQAASDQRIVLLQENTQTITDFAVGATEIIAQAAAANEDIAKSAGKALTVMLLDMLEKVILASAFQVQAASTASVDPANVASGFTLGIGRGIILAGLVKALFSVAKAQILGAYTGERSIGYDGERPVWQGKDGYIRRVHRGEDIIASDKTRKYRGELDAIHDGRLEEYIAQHYRVNDVLRGDTGQRLAASVMLAPYYDKNIVGELEKSRKEERTQSELLAIIATGMRNRSSRYR